MSVESLKLANVTSGARKMAQALEIQLTVNALPQDRRLLVLIERAAAGDTAAFEQIMIHSQQRVMAMTWRMLGNEADARDASQEVFLRVFKYLGRFKQDQDFFAWLFTITVNVCRDISRKREQHRGGSSGFDEAEVYAVPSEQADAEETLLRNQERELIAQAMATLPVRERASIVLRDIEGFSTDEVARMLNSSPTTVRSQTCSARKKIKIYCERYLRRKERKNSHEV